MTDTLRCHHSVSFLEPERVTLIRSTQLPRIGPNALATRAGELHPGNMDVLRFGELAQRRAECEHLTFSGKPARKPSASFDQGPKVSLKPPEIPPKARAKAADAGVPRVARQTDLRDFDRLYCALTRQGRRFSRSAAC